MTTPCGAVIVMSSSAQMRSSETDPHSAVSTILPAMACRLGDALISGAMTSGMGERLMLPLEELSVIRPASD